MHNRIEKIKDQLPEGYKDIAVLARHIFDAFDKLVGEHRRLIAIKATARIKPNPDEERTFFETINQVKMIILDELEKTTQDIEHKGDKNWDKNYRDGIE
ncbi:hypothetical protein F7731_21130 [Cytobacillus depressus]|uniref:Uncharacterized protein n=2 Tax=Cytobacillus depressus TaxID=1602942 RepID=A0A6L3V250_9BACI|nr:hypothetical protein F7731_21130 [Cytobacillus depressus]